MNFIRDHQTDGAVLPVSEKAQIATAFSFEASPKQIADTPEILAAFPPGTDIYVPHLPGAAFAERVGAAARLVRLGHRPVPHLTARTLSGRSELEEQLDQFKAVGVDAVLLIAGDRDRPQGPFTDTLDILETGALAKAGIRRIAVAGHPQGHPKAEAQVMDRSLAIKQFYAHEHGVQMWIVTQFLFDLGDAVAWETRIRDRGITLPVRLGVAGPAKLHTVISYALRCGIGASARMLTKRPDVTKLFARWSPDELVAEFETDLHQRPESLFAGLHFFPFGGLKALAGWRDARTAETGDA